MKSDYVPLPPRGMTTPYCDIIEVKVSPSTDGVGILTGNAKHAPVIQTRMDRRIFERQKGVGKDARIFRAHGRNREVVTEAKRK